jgi:hypothetical protein
MITETKKAPPETLGALAASLAELAGHIDEVTKGLEEFPFTKQTEVLLARMEQTEVDGPLAAFDGFLYAWMLAKLPELYGILSIEDHSYRQYVVLRRNHEKLSLLIPRVFKYVDQSWAERNEPEDGE